MKLGQHELSFKIALEKLEDVEGDVKSGVDGIAIPEVTVTLNDFAVNLDSSFCSLETTLADLIHSTSSALASATNKLSAILHNFTETSAEYLNETLSFLIKNLPDVFSTIQETVNNLNIGTDIPSAILAIGKNLIELLQIVNTVDHSKFSVTQTFDAAAFSVGTKLQVLVATITTAAEAAATNIGTIKDDVKEKVVAVTLVLDTVLLVTQSAYYSIGTVLSNSQAESSTLNSLLLATDGTVQLIASVVKSITKAVTEKMAFVIGTLRLHF